LKGGNGTPSFFLVDGCFVSAFFFVQKSPYLKRKKHMNLKRIKHLPPDFPIAKALLYKWNHYQKFPNFIVKVGGMVMIDLDELPNIVKKKNVVGKECEAK
jgi:hypothetical protein